MFIDRLWNLNIAIFNIGGFLKKFAYFFIKHDVYSAKKRNSELYKVDNSNINAYLCALGPSLKQVNLNRICGDTIVVNRFYKFGKDYPDFVPTYYLIIDGDFTDERYVKDLEDAIKNYVDKGTKFIFNSKIAKHPLMHLVPKEQLFFVSCLDGRVKTNKDYKIDGFHPAFFNVAGEAILLLMLMGYKNITLLGCDFNSFASTKQAHCYSDDKKERLWSMYIELFSYAFAAKDHCDLAVISQKRGCKIINSTKGSLIDAYPVVIDSSLYMD